MAQRDTLQVHDSIHMHVSWFAANMGQRKDPRIACNDLACPGLLSWIVMLECSLLWLLRSR